MVTCLWVHSIVWIMRPASDRKTGGSNPPGPTFFLWIFLFMFAFEKD